MTANSTAKLGPSSNYFKNSVTSQDALHLKELGMRSATDMAGRYAERIKDEGGALYPDKILSSISIPIIESSGGQGTDFVRPSTAIANKVQYSNKKSRVIEVTDENMYALVNQIYSL